MCWNVSIFFWQLSGITYLIYMFNYKFSLSLHTHTHTSRSQDSSTKLDLFSLTTQTYQFGSNTWKWQKGSNVFHKQKLWGFGTCLRGLSSPRHCDSSLPAQTFFIFPEGKEDREEAQGIRLFCQFLKPLPTFLDCRNLTSMLWIELSNILVLYNLAFTKNPE